MALKKAERKGMERGMQRGIEKGKKEMVTSLLKLEVDRRRLYD
ncbi:hypothetical protein BX659_1613 [Orenia metallireducens]|uniref:Uncharacterized protein n=1 Tax=Orenia metallireducens TaxID=1413210 RepID=A0A285IIV8_9FIRM|nr:hypothetical protein BX659_1613 [Orenia metallireducens]SNY47902.1 hypothetical protein SAMN06265827_1613 [Orenia metallireducens]